MTAGKHGTGFLSGELHLLCQMRSPNIREMVGAWAGGGEWEACSVVAVSFHDFAEPKGTVIRRALQGANLAAEYWRGECRKVQERPLGSGNSGKKHPGLELGLWKAGFPPHQLCPPHAPLPPQLQMHGTVSSLLRMPLPWCLSHILSH